MKLHVIHDKDGRILAASVAVEKAPIPVAKPDTTLAELEVPQEFANKKPSEFMHQLRIDVKAKKLVKKR